MHATRSGSNHQRHRIHQYRQTDHSYQLFNLLSHGLLHDEITSYLPEYRDRLYSPIDSLSMFLTQAMNEDRSCQFVVNQRAAQHIANDGQSISTATGAYCRARSRLLEDMIKHVTRYLGSHISCHSAAAWRWHGRRVKVVDGSTAGQQSSWLR